jgi:sugar phosphate isomerase/epimerase
MRELVLPTFTVMSYSLNDGMKILADAGVRFIEIHGNSPELHINLLDDGIVDTINEAIAETPIVIHSVHSAFDQPDWDYWDITNPDADARLSAIKNWQKVIKVGARLNAQHVTFHPGTPKKSFERMRICRESLPAITDTALECNITVSLENLPPDYLYGSVEEMAQILDTIDSKLIGFCLDTGHAMIGPDAINDYIQAFSDRMNAIHWHSGENGLDAHIFPTVADTDWSEFFTALNDVRYYKPIIVESAPPDNLPLAKAVRDVENLLGKSCIRSTASALSESATENCG